MPVAREALLWTGLAVWARTPPCVTGGTPFVPGGFVPASHGPVVVFPGRQRAGVRHESHARLVPRTTVAASPVEGSPYEERFVDPAGERVDHSHWLISIWQRFGCPGRRLAWFVGMSGKR